MSKSQPESSAPIADLAPQFEVAIQRLHQLILWGRWLAVIVLWLGLAPLSLYALRSEVTLWFDYFTWSALRYGLAFNPMPTLGLALCLASLLSALLWQSQHALLGISDRERQRLLRRVQRIHQQGPSHPLWRWTFGQTQGEEF